MLITWNWKEILWNGCLDSLLSKKCSFIESWNWKHFIDNIMIKILHKIENHWTYYDTL